MDSSENFCFQISTSLSLLKMQEEYDHSSGTVKGREMLKDSFTRLKHGLDFLERLLSLSRKEDICHHIKRLVSSVKQKLDTLGYEQKRDTDCSSSSIMYLDDEFTKLREEMKSVFIEPGTNGYEVIFADFFVSMSDFKTTVDFLLEKIKGLMADDLVAPALKELKELKKMLTSLKPLYMYVADIQCQSYKEEKQVFTTLSAMLERAMSLIYLCFIERTDEEMKVSVKNTFSILMKETDVEQMYLVTLKADSSRPLSSSERDLYLLHNIMRLLARNSSSLNFAHYRLYGELSNIKSFIEGLKENVRLKKRCFFQASFEAILCRAIPMMCLGYAEHLEEDMVRESDRVLLDVLDRIKLIKSETKEIKLYYYPRTDALGFLDFFSGYLLELLESEGISTFKNEIGRLYFEIFSLIYLLKVTTQNDLIVEAPWTCIIHLAYQAEYVIDLYLLSPTRDSILLSSLSNIIQQVNTRGVEVHALLDKRIQPQDVENSSQGINTSTQISNNGVFVGFQEEASMIMEFLLGGEKELDIISVAGMAGVGKTTMAVSMYKTSTVAMSFDIQAWCTVAQSYKKRDLLLTILSQVTPHADYLEKLNDQELADHLCRSLKKRRYLIILDDIWDATAWNYLRWYLPDDRQGSRVLITTRYWTVGSEIKIKVLELRGLTDEESWELLRTRLPEKESLSEGLQDIAKEIAVSCKGLPLSIVIIAGILSDVENTEKKWNEIAECVTSVVLADPQGKCRAILELSYKHLPNHLRPCFLYLGAFPEGQPISVSRLIRLYVAEGFVRDTESQRAEEIAEGYIQDLIFKSLVISARERLRGGVMTCRLHDLLRDFCIDKAKEEHFLSVFDKRNNSRPLQDVRRLSIISRKVNSTDGLPIRTHDLDFSYHNVRSLISFSRSVNTIEIDKRIESYDMVLLRVLDLCELEVTPTLLTRLVHLRYLAIWKVPWKSSALLYSITKLWNLQTLILKYDRGSLVEVPYSIWDMVKLRHVVILPRVSFRVDSKQIQKPSYLLENLRSLSNICLSHVDSKWLSKLPALQKLSCIFFHSWDDLLEDNCFPVLNHNTRLTSLRVKNGVDYVQRVRCRLQLPANLRKLTLSNFFLNSDDIMEIGRALPDLQVLKLDGFGFCSWTVGDDDFLQLKVLKLRGLNFATWVASENSFPRLEQLMLENCQYLQEIPEVFGYITKLRLISIRNCNPLVEDSAREILKIQHEDQNTNLKLNIYSIKTQPHTH